MRTRVRVCSAGCAYFSNDQLSKLILILQKMLLGFRQLMAIKELCWGVMCSVWREFNCTQCISLFATANSALII